MADRLETHRPGSLFDNDNALFGAIDEAFKSAAEDAVAENDRLGITTHGAKDGRLTKRQPAKKPVRRTSRG